MAIVVHDPYSPSAEDKQQSNHGNINSARHFYSLSVIVAPLVVALIGVIAVIWHFNLPTYAPNGQREINLKMNSGKIAKGSNINLSLGESVSILLSGANQSQPEEISIPAFNTQTTVAQNSVSNLELTANEKGTFPIYLTSEDGIRSVIGKVVVE